MEEKSGIEKIDEILFRLGELEKMVKVLDQNIKSILNSTRLSEIINKAANTSLSDWSRSVPQKVPKSNKNIPEQDPGFKNFKFETTDAAKYKKKKVPTRKGSSSKPRSIMVKGKIITSSTGNVSPIANVTVKIFDDKDNLVKETKTNRAGHWMSQLPTGKYVALFEGEVNGKKLVPQNRNFEVPENLPDGQFSIEVT